MKKRILITFIDLTLYLLLFIFTFGLITNQYFVVLLVFGPLLALLVRDYLKARKKFDSCL